MEDYPAFDLAYFCNPFLVDVRLAATFIFFISSSFIKWFRDVDAVKAYIDTDRLDFKGKKPKECHRIIADNFRNLIPADKEYIHHLTIQKETNYYGLIFGTSHALGRKKFIKVCEWIYSNLSWKMSWRAFSMEKFAQYIRLLNEWSLPWKCAIWICWQDSRSN